MQSLAPNRDLQRRTEYQRWRPSIAVPKVRRPPQLDSPAPSHCTFRNAMNHRNVQPHVSINEVACYRTERTLAGCSDPASKGVGAPHQCPRFNQKRRGWGEFVTHTISLTGLMVAAVPEPNISFTRPVMIKGRQNVRTSA